jgi:hypothetical protein
LAVPPLSVPSAAEDLDDAEEVFLEFLLWRRVLSAEDSNDGAVEGKDVFEIKGKATQSITLRHDNHGETSTIREIQERSETLAVPVDPGTDVGHNVCAGIFPAEEFDLAIEVISLFWRRDASIQKWSGLLVIAITTISDSICFRSSRSANSFNVIQPTPRRRDDALDFPVFCPSSECRIADSEDVPCFSWGDKFRGVLDILHRAVLSRSVFYTRSVNIHVNDN